MREVHRCLEIFNAMQAEVTYFEQATNYNNNNNNNAWLTSTRLLHLEVTRPEKNCKISMKSKLATRANNSSNAFAELYIRTVHIDMCKNIKNVLSLYHCLFAANYNPSISLFHWFPCNPTINDKYTVGNFETNENSTTIFRKIHWYL